MRRIILAFYWLTVLASGLLAWILFDRRHEAILNMLFVYAFIAYCTASALLIWWATRIRTAPRGLWVQGTEVVRGATTLFWLLILLLVVVVSFPSLDGYLTPVAQTMLAVLAFGSWMQCVGPGWTHYLEAREALSRDESGGRLLTSRHEFTYGLIVFPMLMDLIAVQALMAGYSEVSSILPAFLVIFAISAYFLSMAVRARRTQGLHWAKATQAARQFTVPHLIFIVLILSGTISDDHAIAVSSVSQQLWALILTGVWVLIFGPSRTALVQALDGHQATSTPDEGRGPAKREPIPQAADRRYSLRRPSRSWLRRPSRSRR